MPAPSSMMDLVLTGFKLCVCRYGRSAECSRPFGGCSELHRRAIRALVDVIGSREIAAGVGPADGRRNATSLAGRPAHEVSILFGVGRHFGSQPGAKVSMTIKQ
jgi:hypothetical protein